MKETQIYLFTEGTGWQLFSSSDKDELQKRNITIGNGAQVGEHAAVSNGAWIGNDATIGEQVWIGERVTIGNDATIGEWAWIGERVAIGNFATIGERTMVGNRAKVGEHAKVGNGAQVGEHAKIGNGAWIGNGAKVGEHAKIGNMAKINNDCTPRCLYINGSKHSVAYWGEDVIQIGCKKRTIKGWEQGYQSAGEVAHYSKEQIQEYNGYIQIIKSLHISK